MGKIPTTTYQCGYQRPCEECHWQRVPQQGLTDLEWPILGKLYGRFTPQIEVKGEKKVIISCV